MLIVCPKCSRRHEVPRSGADLLATCPCGEKVKILAWLSYKRIFSERGRVTCPTCDRDYDLASFRMDTELACSCGCLFLVRSAAAAAKARGRRKADQSDRLLEAELRGLVDTAKLIHGSSQDLDKLLTMVIRIAAETLGAEGATIALRDKSGGLVFRFVTSEGDSSRLASLRLAEGEGIVGDCVAKKLSFIVNDPAGDPRFSKKADDKSGFVTRSVLCVPLTVDAVCIGALEAVNKKDPGGFTRHDLALAEALAGQIAVAVRNALLARAQHRKPAKQG
ncbi:MAG: GAF domain-containing protein [Elusimicrobiota bacterium]|jgi:transcriptional regulator with GAF, ATPase, and Fis domain